VTRAFARMNREHLLATIALMLGVVLCAGSLARAVRVEAAPASARVTPESLPVPDVPDRGDAGAGVDAGLDPSIDAAVDVDPFHPARTRPGARYVPGGGIPSGGAPQVAAGPPRAPLPMLRLTGVVTRRNGRGMAAISVNGRPARLVSVGETIEGLRLTRVQAGAATLTRPDTTLVVRLPGAPGQP
jgi:hypothetical protein